MSEGIFGRMFGPCLRGWWQETDTNANKYIDYAPNRKWRYNDKTLMNELTKEQVNTTDVMDLADDEYVNGKIASNGKLQLHDNVFVKRDEVSYLDTLGGCKYMKTIKHE